MIGWGLIGLFSSCFLSATILPFPSEVTFIYFLRSDYAAWIVLLVATIGNSLGGITNYYIGALGQKLVLKNRRNSNAYQAIERFGVWAALGAWLPIIGDPIMLGLGFFQTKKTPTFILMTLGKFIRYYSIYWALT
jgi:membrane protein YqaA with SNARE-associated domain